MLQPLLQNYEGNLLILYGDTPLFSPASIRGLINRHLLCEADLTVMTSVAVQYYPYGRVIRDPNGLIIDIIEEGQASEEEKEIHELNVGAYVVSAREIWPALETQGAQSSRRVNQLTSSIHSLIPAWPACRKLPNL